MPKREREEETKEERRARKRAKKEAKAAKKEAKAAKKEKKRVKAEKKRKSEIGATTVTTEALQERQDALETSNFYKKRLQLVVSILPASLHNVIGSVEGQLRVLLLKHINNVGVLLCFNNLRLLGSGGHGRILAELPFIHYKVGLDAIVFCPEVGSKLSGKVTESFPSHLSVLVLDYFNAMIPSERLLAAGFSFDAASLRWHADEKPIEFTKGDTVIFDVGKIHECGGMLSMEGLNPRKPSVDNNAGSISGESSE